MEPKNLCNMRRTVNTTWRIIAIVVGLSLCTADASAARAPRKQREGLTEEARLDFKAYEMLKRGAELLEMKQEERGIKLIASIPQMFPKSKVRYQAYLALGGHYVERRQYELAIKQYEEVENAEDEEERAEALYSIGICYYNLNNFDKAFMSLRKVTDLYPWSVYANEAFYYIGQCHFKLGRWAKAVEALTMVGTSVPVNVEGETKSEAGQRLFVKVQDKDLVVLLHQGEQVKVELTTAAGDTEVVVLEPLGQTGEYYVGSIDTAPGVAVPNDNILQFIGSETVTVKYVDENTEDGKRMVPVIANVQLVSTASVGFTDGAYKEYVQGVFGDSDCFMRVKDLDRDTTEQQDEIKARVLARYKIERDQAANAAGGVDLTEYSEEYEVRDFVTVTLREDGAHTGMFVGTLRPVVVGEGVTIDQSDEILNVMKGDDIVLEYYDDVHMLGPDPRAVTAKAKVLVGEIQDVKIEHRVVDSIDLKARKNLIEAKIYLRLGSIFKDVGLTQKANEKAEQGLERVEEVISTSLKASLERTLVEEAFSVKWELLLVQDRLNEAIQVCRTLTRLFPDSTLVDQALLKIGTARMETDEDPHAAIGIFNAIVNLPKSNLKAEAQYQIAQAHELYANRHARNGIVDLSHALLAYKKCAETYPESPFAGEALEKIANFYITSRDYARAIELMERVFQDYPDASFLDTMLLKWVIAAYRMGNFEIARQKCERLLADYPSSKFAEKAQQFQSIIAKKLNN